MSEPARQQAAGAAVTARYLPDDVDLGDATDVLARIDFGDGDGAADPDYGLRVGLRPIHGVDLAEVWRASGPVRRGRAGAIRYSEDGEHLFGMLEIDEGEPRDIGAAARDGYAQLMAFQSASGKPHLLRIWNYFDAITEGEGDDERYQRFCIGRAEGLGEHQLGALPAATAIGRRDGRPILQMYWLAAAHAGTPLENPRQVSAYHYPRQYGPVPPRFARAMLASTGELLISGTASVVGHATHHDGDVEAQLQETLRNLDALLQQAHVRDALCPRQFGADALLKVYLRHPGDADPVVALLRQRLPPGMPLLVLEADICRRDLLIEIDGTHR